MGTCGRITGTAAGSWGKSQVHYGNLLWNSGSGKFIEMLKCYICIYQTTRYKNNFWKNPSIKGTFLKTIILINMFMERYIHLCIVIQVDKYHTKIGLGWNQIREAFTEWPWSLPTVKWQWNRSSSSQHWNLCSLSELLINKSGWMSLIQPMKVLSKTPVSASKTNCRALIFLCAKYAIIRENVCLISTTVM